MISQRARKKTQTARQRCFNKFRYSRLTLDEISMGREEKGYSVEIYTTSIDPKLLGRHFYNVVVMRNDFLWPQLQKLDMAK